MSSSQHDGANVNDATDEEPPAEQRDSQEGDASVGGAHAETQICSVIMAHF